MTAPRPALPDLTGLYSIRRPNARDDRVDLMLPTFGGAMMIAAFVQEDIAYGIIQLTDLLAQARTDLAVANEIIGKQRAALDAVRAALPMEEDQA